MSDFIGNGLVRNFIGGTWTEGDEGRRIAVEDPDNEEQVADCALAGQASLRRALSAACAALMRRIAEEIRALAEEGAELLRRESGKTLSAAQEEFEEAGQYFEYYGGVADKIDGKSIPLGPDYVDYIVYEPHGVSARTVPPDALPGARRRRSPSANRIPYGLVAGVFTRDLARAHRVAGKLRAGQVFVNEWFASGISTPGSGSPASAGRRASRRSTTMRGPRTSRSR